ncbi:MAG: hypothetical protein CME30_02740, partial [Gemmatimonadetes bacterium]|nr:hypothetical protein [Gemmatimonadota bacterium]
MVLALSLTVFWYRQERTKNATSVDVAWSLGITILIMIYGVTFSERSFQGALVVTLSVIWSLRLGFFLLKDRILQNTLEDGRYAALRVHWGAKASFN